jgi:hypothetical protein
LAASVHLKSKRDGKVMNSLRMLAELGNQELARNVSGLRSINLPKRAQILCVYLSQARDHRERNS